ncbi:hypothetical protein U3516DRAFT_858187 [Neocallimastix sp. 'constans']
MEDNIEIEISETNRGNEQIIINKKHKFNFSFQRKDKSKIYRCTEYKTLNKCKSLIILNDKKEVLKYESLHNHLEKEIDVSISVAKHKIKEEIKKNSIPMDIKPKHIFNVVSQEMRLICPEYSTIRSQIIRNINKQFPPNIKTYLFSNYHKNIFADGTFYEAPKFIFHNINIKYCVWHYKRSLEKQKNILCYHEVKNNNDFLIELLHSVSKIRTLVQWLVTLTMTNTSWCKPIEFSPFCKHLRYNYENIEHLTNNASESYNSYLNNIFPNKPIFYKLIYILKEEENLSYNDYQRRTKGNWKKKQKIFSATDEIKILIENYKSKEINLFYNGCNRNELIKLWKECLIDLNDININLK